MLTHAIQRIEGNGALDDHDALRQAAAKFTNPQERLIERARILSHTDGMAQELQTWYRYRLLATIALVLLAYLISTGMLDLFGRDKTINTALVFFTILLIPLVMLIVWMISAIFNGLFANQGSWSAGNLVLSTIGKWRQKYDKNSIHLVEAIRDTVQRNGLAIWLFGEYSHRIWIITYSLVLLTLLKLFFLQSFNLVWETTILSSESLNNLVQASGWLPSQFGFSIPTDLTFDVVSSPAQSRTTALWLIGCTLIYGLLPRVIAFLVSRYVLTKRLGSQLKLDLTDIYFAKILNRFEKLETSEVLDTPLPRKDDASVPSLSARKGLALIGFELSQDQRWPPAEITPNACVNKISGALDEIDTLKRALTVSQPKVIVVGVDAAASPDRGAAQFLRALQPLTHHIALLMIDSNRQDHGKPRRWEHWQKENDLKHIAFLANVADAQKWLQDKND